MGMGYQGFVQFGGDKLVLATGASVNLVLEPIYSQAVWGAGWYNAATSAHYADAALRYEGNVDIELQMGALGAIWDFMEQWIFSKRAYAQTLHISPDGARVFKYTATVPQAYDNQGAWNTQASFSTSEGSFVSVSLGVIALDRAMTDPNSPGGQSYSNYTYILQKTGAIASVCSQLGVTNPLNPLGANVDPIPFWRTNANLWTGTYSAPFSGGSLPQSGLETVEWSLDIGQGNVVLYTCSGSRLPTAVLQGPMDVSGSVVLYHTDGVFDPILGDGTEGTITSPFLYAQITWFRIEITTDTIGTKVYLEVPAVVVESDEYSIQGLDAPTNRTFGIKGLGGRCHGDVTLPPCIMSDHLGAFVDP